MMSEIRFFSVVTNETQEYKVRLMIESLRRFGGVLRDTPVWLFYWDGYRADISQTKALFEDIDSVQLLPLVLDDDMRGYYFGAKVSACAQAELLAAPDIIRIVWFAAECLVINPPELLMPDPRYDASLRVVHHCNVGIHFNNPLDTYWKKVYSAVGLEDTSRSVRSFVDGEIIRPYFNSHIFAIDPGKGLMKRWFSSFRTLTTDKTFQQEACQDQSHQIFLHQAILSALITADLDWNCIRHLPYEYSYPLHFHEEVPEDERAEALNDLVCIAYEDTNLDPEKLESIQMHEPLKSWLAKRIC